MPPDSNAALCSRLAELVTHLQADNAAVMDESGESIWGHAVPLNLDEDARVHETLAIALASTGDKPLHRGGHVRLLREDVPPFVLAESFAGIYLLLVWFDTPFDGAVARALVRRALPEIEALTLQIPPPDGTNTAAARLRR